MLKTGNNDLDFFLGRIGEGIILIYGAAATGKTTFGLQCCLAEGFEKKVLFLDTEHSFSLDRVKQMKLDYKKYLENMFVVNLNSFEELDKRLEFFETISNQFNRYVYMLKGQIRIPLSLLLTLWVLICFFDIITSNNELSTDR